MPPEAHSTLFEKKTEHDPAESVPISWLLGGSKSAYLQKQHYASLQEGFKFSKRGTNLDSKKAFTRAQRERIAAGVLMRQKFGKDLTRLNSGKDAPGVDHVVTGSNASGKGQPAVMENPYSVSSSGFGSSSSRFLRSSHIDESNGNSMSYEESMKHHGYRKKKIDFGLSVTPLALEPSPMLNILSDTTDEVDDTSAAFMARQHRKQQIQRQRDRDTMLAIYRTNIDQTRHGDAQAVAKRAQCEAVAEIRAKMASKAHTDMKRLRAANLLKHKMDLDNATYEGNLDTTSKKLSVQQIKADRAQTRLRMLNSVGFAGLESMPTVVSIPFGSNTSQQSGNDTSMPLATSSTLSGGLDSHLIRLDSSSSAAAHHHHSVSEMDEVSDLPVQDRLAFTQPFISGTLDAVELLALQCVAVPAPRPSTVKDPGANAVAEGRDFDLIDSTFNRSMAASVNADSLEVGRIGWKIPATQEHDFCTNRQDTFVFGGGFNVG